MPPPPATSGGTRSVPSANKDSSDTRDSRSSMRKPSTLETAESSSELAARAAAIHRMCETVQDLSEAIKHRPYPGQRCTPAPAPANLPPAAPAPVPHTNLPEWVLELPKDPNELSHWACDHLIAFEQHLHPDRLLALMDLVQTDPHKADLYLRLRREDVRKFWLEKMLRELGFPPEEPEASNDVIMMTRHDLFSAAQSLCNDFASNKDIAALLSHFSTTTQPSAVEHGEAHLAPFLGRTFVGLEGVQSYFEMIAENLTHKNMRFSEYIVDVEEKKVAVKGHAEFTWIDTDEIWDETFAYMLDFDEHAKVVRYQVWADSGAAYLAQREELEQRREEAE